MEARNKIRLDHALVARGLTTTRSQAESYIRMGEVWVNGRLVAKPGAQVAPTDKVDLRIKTQYVSRAGLKLSSVSDSLGLSFIGKTVLDVGSSTGGFTDYALRHGAGKVIAVEVGKNQFHSSLRSNEKIELHEQTDIRSVYSMKYKVSSKNDSQDTLYQILDTVPDIIVIDVSFISLREVLPHIAKNIAGPGTQLVAMVKPQFEATATGVKHKGVIKNEAMRRDILKDFEAWAKQSFVILKKADSHVAGEKGNRERFYLLAKIK